MGEASGALLHTTDGGRSWQRQAAPPRVSGVCFVGPEQGWLAADELWATADGGATWQPTGVPEGRAVLAHLECAPGGAWVVAGRGGAMGCQRHELYRAPIGLPPAPVLANPCHAPPTDLPRTAGLSASGLSVVDAATAVLAGYTAPLPSGQTTTMAVVLGGGGEVRYPGTPVPTVSASSGVAFTTADRGWVIGVPSSAGGSGPSQGVIARTTDGGRWWEIRYWTG